MLSTISNNLLKEPDNEKFKRFKPTNPLIKKNLVDVKGALEYAIAVKYDGLHQFIVINMKCYRWGSEPKWSSFSLTTRSLPHLKIRLD
jgi:hypothetical protein